MEILTKIKRPSPLSVGGIFFLLCLIMTFQGISQKKHTLKNVKGEWVVSDDITLPQAKEKAVAEAKVEALRQAGVPEYISQSNLSYTAQGVAGMASFFESMTTLDVFGEISEFKIVKEERKFNSVGNIVYNVWIDATVVIHKEAKDPGFSCDITGIKSSYDAPGKLSFEVKPWKDGYLQIFIISEEEGNQLYPSKFEPGVLLKAESSYAFPKKGFQYEVTTSKQTEVNYLIFLLTKQDIPFREKETTQNILRYIGSISPHLKTIRTFSILVKKQ